MNSPQNWTDLTFDFFNSASTFRNMLWDSSTTICQLPEGIHVGYVCVSQWSLLKYETPTFVSSDCNVASPQVVRHYNVASLSRFRGTTSYFSPWGLIFAQSTSCPEFRWAYHPLVGSPWLSRAKGSGCTSLKPRRKLFSSSLKNFRN